MYSKFLYVRTINEGLEDEFQISGTTPEEVDESVADGYESCALNVARYVLVGLGTVHNSVATYVEHTTA